MDFKERIQHPLPHANCLEVDSYLLSFLMSQSTFKLHYHPILGMKIPWVF